MGSQLASIHSQGEQDFLAGHIRDHQPVTSFGYFIGLNDIDNETTWKWTDGTQVDFNAWNEDEPSNVGDNDCVGMYGNITQQDSRGLWTDFRCNGSMAYICRTFKACRDRLGVEDGRISDSQITASTEHASNHGATNARLNRVAQAGTAGAWSAQANDVNPWIQAALGIPTWVTGVLIQGREDWSQWVTKFKVQYSHDPDDWKFVQDPNGTIIIFDGNTDQTTVVTNLFPTPVIASYIRILPTAWHVHISMRFELVGCEVVVNSIGCTPGWEGYNNYCYFFDHAAAVTYFEANKSCSDMGSQLVSIHSQQEQDILAGHIRDHQQVTSLGYFIGLNDIDDETTWKWTDGTQVDFNAWTEGEPNNVDDEDCVGMYGNITQQDSRGLWNDFRCNASMTYICRVFKECMRPLGMGNYEVADDKITTSS
ncbi:macrophage mannose receptor 1-like [Amphiura filiformis]|uniref:macrophage mannose receptor 1-like n=1 Tax=Amphiura filiformis TaxID=82378 RepID=UPI003B2191AA